MEHLFVHLGGESVGEADHLLTSTSVYSIDSPLSPGWLQANGGATALGLGTQSTVGPRGCQSSCEEAPERAETEGGSGGVGVRRGPGGRGQTAEGLLEECSFWGRCQRNEEEEREERSLAWHRA